MRVASPAAEKLKTYDLRKLGNIRKLSKLHRMRASPPCQNEHFVNTNKKLLKGRN